jgi:hypothetical protein
MFVSFILVQTKNVRSLSESLNNAPGGSGSPSLQLRCWIDRDDLDVSLPGTWYASRQ